MYSDEELYHLSRLEGRLDTKDVKAAFAFLMDWAEKRPYIHVHPLSRGAFSAVHLSTKATARKYADCEFAFKGAKDHMRFWFRKPAFESGIIRISDMARFDTRKKDKLLEVATDIHDEDEARAVSTLIEERLKQSL